MMPNVEGNRHADEVMIEDQAAYRRVRLTKVRRRAKDAEDNATSK